MNKISVQTKLIKVHLKKLIKNKTKFKLKTILKAIGMKKINLIHLIRYLNEKEIFKKINN